MKIPLLISLALAAPNLSFATKYEINKLTPNGVLNVQIESSKKKKAQETLPSEDAALSFSGLKIKKTNSDFSTSKPKSLVTKEHLKIAVIGDTGCRLKEGANGSEYQDCSDPKAWPFLDILKSIKKDKPDFVIHLGDYHYREHCSKGKPCEKMTPTVGYGWNPWELDFFSPLAKSSLRAPWIFARGNHEGCDRAFLGYGLLLATKAFSDTCEAYEEAEYFEFKDLLIVNFDSSAVPEQIAGDNLKVWTERFQKMEARLADTKYKSIWLITHKPFYGLVKMGSQAAPTNINLKKVLEASPLKSKFELLLAGHIHLSQIIKPTEGPIQFVLGNGGTQLDTFGDFLAKTNPQSLGLDSIQTGVPGFGYALFERKTSSKNWEISLKSPRGELTLKCILEVDKKTCVPRK